MFNAPFSNTRSVAELVTGEIMVLLRGVPTKSAKAHKGISDKSVGRAAELQIRFDPNPPYTILTSPELQFADLQRNNFV